MTVAAAETARDKLQRARQYVVAMGADLTKYGAQYLGQIEEYSNPQDAKQFKDKFNAILTTIKAWGATASKMAADPNADQTLMFAVADDGLKLGKAINDFNRATWWAKPSKALQVIEAPFRVAAAVAADVVDIVETGGQSLLSGLQFSAKHAFGIVVLVGLAWLFGPRLIEAATRQTARKAGE